jgi:hypothetical protein
MQKSSWAGKEFLLNTRAGKEFLLNTRVGKEFLLNTPAGKEPNASKKAAPGAACTLKESVPACVVRRSLSLLFFIK